MNRIHSIIWSRAQSAWVVASEFAKRRGKGRAGIDKRKAASDLTYECVAAKGVPHALVRPLQISVLLALCNPARAVDYYWDINANTAGAGGPTPSGTWSTIDTTLSTDSTGSIGVVSHTTTTADRLFFSAATDATGAYAVTVNGTQNIGRLTFQEGTVNLTGGTINFGAVAAVIDGDATGDTISSVITGTNGLRFNGGAITLTGTNTFTGTASLGGTLAQANVILAAAGGNAISGSALSIGSGSQSTGGGTVSLGAAEQINNTATLTMSSGHYSGSSVFSLNGFNETLGGINLGHNGNGSSVTVRNSAATDATLTLAGSGTYTTASGDRVGGRSIQNGGAGRLNVVVALTGSGLQTFAGTAPSYTGTTTVQSGTLQLWNTSLWASNTTLNGGTLQLHQTLSAPVAAGGGAPSPRTHANTIGGTGGTLLKTGDSTVILTGANTYQGATQIDLGTLRAGSATAFGNNSAVTLANVAGTTMDLNGFNISIGSLAGGGTTGGNVTMGAGNLTAGGNNTSTNYAGVIGGTGTVTKTGTGTLTLSGANTYSGLTTVSAGTLQLGSGGATGSIASAQATVAAGASLAVNRSDAFALSQNVSGDGTLVQRGTGTTTMSTNSNIGHVVLEHGRLVTPGTLLTDDIGFTNDGGATLQVAGVLQTSAAGAALVTGGALNDTVRIDAGASMLANGTLGDGGDTLDVAGTLNTAGGGFDLGAGDDFFVFHDNTSVVGNVIGGAGNDTLNANIATSATLSAAQTFETLTKNGAGTLGIVGPGASDFSVVNVNAGTLAVSVGGTLDAPTGGTLATTIAGGATLDVAGSYGCGTGNDTLIVAGTVSGAGAIDLCDGNDTLTLHDGAVLNNAIAISGGTGTGDLLVLNNANTFSLDGTDAIDFELLQKNNGGTSTLTGTHSFVAGTTINGGALDVDGVVETATVVMADATALNVDGTVQDAGATQAAITGSAGINTVTVSAAGTLLANGDLGGGADVLDVAGTVDTGGGVLMLGDGADSLVIHDGTNIIGTVDGGAGFDNLNANIAGIADLGAVSTFEELIKSGAGTLNINGPAVSDFVSVDVQAGTLNIAPAGSLSAVQTATVANGATLIVDGSLSFTPGADAFTVAGVVRGLSTIDLLDGADTLTIQDGADLSGLTTAISGGAGADTLTADIAGSATLGGAIDFETLIKTNSGTFDILGPASSQFDTVLVQGGTLYVGSGAVVDPQTTVVDAGATLTVDGLYTGTIGNDTFTVSGAVNGTGSIGLLDGDDVLTINDGANIGGVVNPIDGGNHTPVGDSAVLNFAIDGAFAGGNVINFENLVKQNAGTVTMTGTTAFSGGTALDGGGLNVAGVLDTPTVAMADATVLNVEGSLQAVGGTAAAITGSAGVNTVSVGTGGTLFATGDLGDGNDVLDVVGTLDTGGGAFLLGDGDDNFAVHDGTAVNGTVDGGAGLDTRTYNINTSANLGALLNFEGVTKTGTGVLNITGPGNTDLQSVEVLAGTLDVLAGASVVATVGTPLNTLVAGGATLNVDGAYGCGNGGDSMIVSGTVAGSGAIDLCGGEDTLTLRDGAVLANTISGGPHGSGDTVLLDNAGALSFDASRTVNFEFLVKDNAGEATLTGNQIYAGGAALNDGTLSVAGVLDTPTVAMADATVLIVEGSLQALGGTTVAIIGSAGVNTVSVAAGGTLLATGDLGDGADVLDVAGTLNTGGGTFLLGDGDDNFMVHDTTSVSGTVDGGLGTDLLDVDVSSGNTVPLGSMLGFESLAKSGGGTLAINGPSQFIDVQLLAGTLNVSGTGSIAAQTTRILNGATLNLMGAYTGTAGDDTFTIAGTVRGIGTLDLADGNDTATIQDGANLSGLASPLDGGAGDNVLVTDIAGSATLGGVINFETLTKTNTGTLHIDGPATSAFSIVNVDGGILDVGTAGNLSGIVTTTVGSGATLHVDGTYAGSAGNDSLTLSGALSGAGTINLLDGDDVLRINTGATVAFDGVVDASAATSDRFVLAGVGEDTFDIGQVGRVFQNFDEFHKEGAGTWRLTGTGDRNWTVSEGTLIGDSASFGGDIANAATVIFDQAVDGTFGGVLSGSGSLIKQNAGTLIVTGVNTFTGSTQVAAGNLQVNGTLPGAITVDDRATLSGIGTVGGVAALAGGFVSPGNAATPFGTLTLTGDYAGGGTVIINAQLGDSSSAASRLVIQGNTSDADSPVLINPAGDNGAQTVGDGIAIIEVGGVSPQGSFHLAQVVQAGAFEYLLYQGGASDANDWFLRSELTDPQLPGEAPSLPAFRPGAAGYVLGPQANLEYGFTALGNLRARVGDQGRVADEEGNRTPDDAWMRAHVDEIDIVGTRFEALDLRIDTLQFGTDVYTYEAGQTTAHFGVMASVGESHATFFDSARALAGLPTRAGDAETDVKGAGIYWTGYGKDGGYFDVAAQILHYRNRYRDAYLGTGDQSGWGGTVSAEVGAPFVLGATNWRIEPQLQIAYQRLELDDFRDQLATVSEVNDDALRARAGARLFRAPTQWLGMAGASPYVAVGVQRDFGDTASVTVGSTAIREEIPDTTADVSVGFTGSVRPGIALHLDVRYQQSTEGERDGVRANFGFRMTF